MSARGLRLGIGVVLAGWQVAIAGAAEARSTIVPPGSRMDDAEARLTHARILSYGRDTWREAIAAYERLLRDRPEHGVALTELAELRIRQGDLDAAESGLRAAVARGMDNAVANVALAKLHLWRNRPAEALELLEKAGRDRALSGEERLALGQVFTALGRHADAIRELDQLIAGMEGPTAEMLSLAADARLTGGDVTGARELYRRALEVDATITGAQRGYALTLAWSGEQAMARDRLQTVLAAAPNDSDVIHAYVRALRETDGLESAIRRARERAEAVPKHARWRAEWADLEAQRGHAVRSRELFAEALALETSPALELQAARAAITWGDFIAAERVLRAALRRNPLDASLRDDLGRLLVSTDRWEEAEQFYEQWLKDAPTAEAAWIGMIRLRMKERNYALASVRCDSLIELRPQLVEALRLKADVLTALGRSREAFEIYGQLALRPETKFEAELARGRSARQRGEAAQAVAHFESARVVDSTRPAAVFYAAGKATTRSEEFLRGLIARADEQYSGSAGRKEGKQDVPVSAPRLVEFAGLYAEQGDFGFAVRCLKAALVADPEYFPAHLQLAEFLAIEADYDSALREFAALRRAMPDNRQILLGEARALAWSRRYEEALDAYARLAALNVADPVPRREAARTAGWGKQRERGAQLYASAWSEGSVDRQLATLLRPVLEGADGSGVALRWREWTEHPESDDKAEPFSWTERFMEERFALRSALPENRRARIDQVQIDVLASLRLQRAWWLENRAKQHAWDRRYASAEREFNRLLAVEPGNQEAMFDLAQVQAAQGLGPREQATLARLVAIDANHRLANDALRRRAIRSAPQAALEGRHWRERGRGELSSLQRTHVAAQVEDTFDHRHVVRVEAEMGRESPATRSGDYAYRAIGFGAESVVTPWLSGSAGFKHRKFYDARIGHADSGQAQIWLKRNSHAFGIGYEKREELTNEFALFQGTRSDQTWIGGTAVLARKLDINARATSMRYSDGNDGWMLLLQPACAWTDHPRIFKTSFTLEARNTDTATVFVRNGSLLTNLIHPYWTPQDYTQGAVTFEWYHDLAKDFFVGGEQHFYDLRLTFGTDSESNPGVTLEADWRREWRDRWIFHGGIYFHESKEWDALGLRLRLARRF